MNNKSLLAIIIVLLLGVIGIMTVQMADRHDDGLSGSISEAAEEIGDEIDDHTTN